MDHLQEAAASMNPAKIEYSLRSKANSALSKIGLDGNKRYPKVASAVNDAWKILSPLGLEPAADVPYIGGKTGIFSQGLRFTNDDDISSPTDITNSVLYMQWAKLETGYEVIGYLS